MLLAENHTEPVIHVNYMPNVSDKFITSSLDGTMRLWDANDYSVKARCVNQIQNVAARLLHVQRRMRPGDACGMRTYA